MSRCIGSTPEALPHPSRRWLTRAIADTTVLHNEVTVHGFEDLDLPLEVPLLIWPAVLQLLHSHQGACVVTQWVIAAQLHIAKVALGRGRAGILTPGSALPPQSSPLTLPSCEMYLRCLSSKIVGSWQA